MSNAARFIGVSLLSVIGSAVLGAGVIFAAAAGHGTFIPLDLCFPFITIVASAFIALQLPVQQQQWVLLLVGLVQFPSYGIILARYWKTPRFRLCGYVLIAVHVGAIVLAVIMRARRLV